MVLGENNIWLQKKIIYDTKKKLMCDFRGK